MDVRSLQTRHSACNIALFKRYNALYKGGQTFRSMIPSFLARQPQDTPAVYELRVQEASYISYVGPIVRKYAGTLFASHYDILSKVGDEPTDLAPAYSALKEDCDGQGTDLTSFFKDRFRQSLVTCASYWLVDMPRRSAEELGMSEDEWKAQGFDRVRLRPLDPQNVIDWEADEDGCFAWVKVYDRSTRRESPASPLLVVETWTIYYVDRVEVYRIEYQPNKPPKQSTVVPMVDSYSHGCARVPVLSMRLPEGLWLLDAAADAQIEHFRLSCAEGWLLRRGSYPLAVFNLESTDEPPVIEPGVGAMMGPNDKFSWVEPTGSTLLHLGKAIAAKKDEIYRVCQQMGMSADSSSGAMGRSGLSKMADAEDTNSCLRDYASIVREAIEATFELVSNALGDYGLSFSVEGLSTFNSQDIESIVDAAKAAREAGIENESETFRIESHCRLADLVLTSDTRQETKNAIREEIRKALKKSQNPGIDTGFLRSSDTTEEQNHGASRTKTGTKTPLSGSED